MPNTNTNENVNANAKTNVNAIRNRITNAKQTLLKTQMQIQKRCGTFCDGVCFAAFSIAVSPVTIESCIFLAISN